LRKEHGRPTDSGAPRQGNDWNPRYLRIVAAMDALKPTRSAVTAKVRAWCQQRFSDEIRNALKFSAGQRV
jgi:hypothetical protein